MPEIGKGNNEPPRPPLVESGERERQKYVGLAKATTVLLSDRPQKPVDAVFFFGRSFFDAEKHGIFQVAADFINDGRGKYLFIPDSEGERMGETTPRIATAGKTLWTDRLVRLGVDRSKIIYSPHPVPGEYGFNTKTEGDAFLKKAAEDELHSAVVLTHPHQIVRAMLGIVATMHTTGQKLDVWSMTPEFTDWNKKVRGSQGMELKPRLDHIQDEIDRIFKYQQKGDIASFDELFSYLTTRDSRQN